MADDRYDRERESERRGGGRRSSGSTESGESSWRREGRGGNGGQEAGERGERGSFGREDSEGWQSEQYGRRQSGGWQGGEPYGGEQYGRRQSGAWQGGESWGGYGSGMHERTGETVRGGRQGRGDRGTQSGSFAGRGPKGYRRSDERIQEDLSEELTQDTGIDASEIEVTVQAGEVTLKGTVDSRETKRRAEDLAEGISGVRQVHNQGHGPRSHRRRHGPEDRGGPQSLPEGSEAHGERPTRRSDPRKAGRVSLTGRVHAAER
jgi:osmotically-inducible protein OsmY